MRDRSGRHMGRSRLRKLLKELERIPPLLARAKGRTNRLTKRTCGYSYCRTDHYPFSSTARIWSIPLPSPFVAVFGGFWRRPISWLFDWSRCYGTVLWLGTVSQLGASGTVDVTVTAFDRSIFIYDNVIVSFSPDSQFRLVGCNISLSLHFFSRQSSRKKQESEAATFSKEGAFN